MLTDPRHDPVRSPACGDLSCDQAEGKQRPTVEFSRWIEDTRRKNGAIFFSYSLLHETVWPRELSPIFCQQRNCAARHLHQCRHPVSLYTSPCQTLAAELHRMRTASLKRAGSLISSRPPGPARPCPVLSSLRMQHLLIQVSHHRHTHTHTKQLIPSHTRAV